MISGAGLSIGMPATAGAYHPYRQPLFNESQERRRQMWALGPRSHSAEGCIAEGCIKDEHPGFPVIGYLTGAPPNLQPWCVPQTAKCRGLFFHIRRRFDQGQSSWPQFAAS